MKNASDEPTVSAAARQAGVGRSFLYRHPELIAELEAARQAWLLAVLRAPVHAGEVTMAGLRADVANQTALNKKLHQQLRTCEDRLARLHGQHLEVVSAEEDSRWKLRAEELERENRQLLTANRRLEEDVSALRQHNRTLTRQLNQKSTP
jgi:hypothetical protein